MDDKALQLGTKEPPKSLASHTSTIEQRWLLDDAIRSSQPKFENYATVAPLGLIAVWAIALLWFRQQQKRRESSGLRHNNSSRQRHRIPCQSCRFFKDSPYLKCAINPMDALTQRAIDCTDYTPNVPTQQEGLGKD